MNLVLHPLRAAARRDSGTKREGRRFRAPDRRYVAACLVAWALAVSIDAGAAPGVPPWYRKQATWGDTLLSTREAWRTAALPDAARATTRDQIGRALEADFPQAWDWAEQDTDGRWLEWFGTASSPAWERPLFARVLDELGPAGAGLRRELEALTAVAATGAAMPATAGERDRRLWELYLRACEQRRALRLATVATRAPRFVFTKRRTLRPSFFAYTEGQSDAQHERHFHPGAELCLGTLVGTRVEVRTWLADPGGMIRDPAVSWDGGRVAFAWKKSLDADDYHVYELEVGSGAVRQITHGLGFADYEPAYLPNGDLVFASTRCVQTVDCWWTEVSNLYTCAPDGRFLRRLGFDQVHTVYPQVLDDGRVIYTRWDYNDRGQVFPQALFQMNPDGTGQMEYYGNNSWFPTTIAHARGLPGSERVLAVFMGHHTAQAGQLGLLEPARGRQENAGARLVAPWRDTPAERIDAYGQRGALFQYPFPLTADECLVGYAPRGWQDAHADKGGADFGLYWMALDGRRERLLGDTRLACQQPVALVARTPPPVRPSVVDYRQATATCYVQDVYTGPALAGLPRGTVSRLRVVALEFRAAGVGNNTSQGPGGGALISTPIAIGNGTWDVKVVLGDATVRADGSAYFTVPARTPFYFQALDARGQAVQTMRSWTTLQPGERAACVGCHEDKNAAPPAVGGGVTLALQAGPETLQPFYGPPRGFSFPKEVQPILDRHCVRCHRDPGLKPAAVRLEGAVVSATDPDWRPGRPLGAAAAGPGAAPPADRAPLPGAAAVAPGATNPPAFSLRGEAVLDPVAKRRWSEAYLNLTLATRAEDDEARGAYVGRFDGRMVHWIGSQSVPTPLPPYAAGAARSELLVLLDGGHHGVVLAREEREKLACWIDLLVPYCGDYLEANAWTPAERAKYQRYLEKRRRMEALERENLRAWWEACGEVAGTE